MGQKNKWDEMTNEALLIEYKQTGDEELKKEIVLRYVYLVKNVALKLRGVYLSFAQVDDMINEGVILLMSAIDKYDPEQNVKFETFISKRLRGLIIDLARRQDWMPRSVRKRMREIEEISANLYCELGRQPTDNEIAAKMGITPEKYQEELAKTVLCNVMSLDMLLEERDGEVPSKRPPQTDLSVQPEEFYQKKELYEVLHESVSSLRENEQMVLSLYYQKSLQMKEIAQVMGVSEPRVSQIHSNAIRKLRVHMEKYMCDT